MSVERLPSGRKQWIFTGHTYCAKDGWTSNVLTAIDNITPKDYQVRMAVPPVVVEAVRRQFLELGDLESATVVSSTNLTGMRRRGALGLDRGQSIEERTIKVFQVDTQGRLGRTKTQEDLDAWYEQTPGWTLVFEENGKPWTANKYAQWRKRVYPTVRLVPACLRVAAACSRAPAA
jgi:hypothetical protein